MTETETDDDLISATEADIGFMRWVVAFVIFAVFGVTTLQAVHAIREVSPEAGLALAREAGVVLTCLIVACYCMRSRSAT